MPSQPGDEIRPRSRRPCAAARCGAGIDPVALARRSSGEQPRHQSDVIASPDSSGDQSSASTVQRTCRYPAAAIAPRTRGHRRRPRGAPEPRLRVDARLRDDDPLGRRRCRSRRPSPRGAASARGRSRGCRRGGRPRRSAGASPGTPPPSGPGGRRSRARRAGRGSRGGAPRPRHSYGRSGCSASNVSATRAAPRYLSTPVITMPRMKTRWKMRNRQRDEQGHDVAGLDERRVLEVDAVEPGQRHLERLQLVVAGEVDQRPEVLVPPVHEREDRDRDDHRPGLGQNHRPRGSESGPRRRSWRPRRGRAGS